MSFGRQPEKAGSRLPRSSIKTPKRLSGPIEIPAHHWPYLKRIDDPLTGKAMLSDDQGRVYREVKFPRLDVKKLWPKSPPLSGEHAETWPSHLALIQLRSPRTWDGPSDLRRMSGRSKTGAEVAKGMAGTMHARKSGNGRNERPIAYIRRLHGLMQKADNVTEVWGYKTFRRPLLRSGQGRAASCTKKRKSPRTV